MSILTLNNGVEIPQLGFGTAAIGHWQRDDDFVKDIILTAIKAGYRHIDTASLYGNERSVGAAIKESGIPREDFFIVSKVWDTEQGYKSTQEAFANSLERLGTDYLDLYLIHWPHPPTTDETWTAMEELHEDKKIRALGLSNFRISDIEDVYHMAKYKPAYNQLELHPYLQQAELCRACNDFSIAVSCWSPLGTGSWSTVPVSAKPISDPVIIDIAKSHNVTPAQVIMKWNLQEGRIVIPKSETKANIENNIDLEGFELSEKDMQNIKLLNSGLRFGANPDTAHLANMQMTVPA